MQLLMLLITAMFLISCGGGSESSNKKVETNQSETNQSEFTTKTSTVQGKVIDINGNRVGNTEITIGNFKAQTNDQGFFALSGIPTGNAITVKADHANYVTNNKVIDIYGESIARVDIKIKKIDKLSIIDSKTGDMVETANGGEIILPANGYIDSEGKPYNGKIKVSATYFDSIEKNFLDLFPGAFQGVTSENKKVDLDTYGFIDVALKDPYNKPINLAPGVLATISYPVDFEGEAPESIPIWYFDDLKNDWIQGGVATLINNKYVATVSHFTNWNLGKVQTLELGTLYGNVVDIENHPVARARVEVRSENWIGYQYTDDKGEYQINVPINKTLHIQATKTDEIYVLDDLITVSEGEKKKLENIIFKKQAKVSITLFWNENPEDLDATLIFNLNNTGQGIVNYTNRYIDFENDGTQDIVLDTDDTNGFGPEIITLYSLKEGVYEYYVNHFKGTSDLSASDALITMSIEGVGTYLLNVPDGAVGERDNWYGWKIDYENEKITVDVINCIGINGSECE